MENLKMNKPKMQLSPRRGAQLRAKREEAVDEYLSSSFVDARTVTVLYDTLNELFAIDVILREVSDELNKYDSQNQNAIDTIERIKPSMRYFSPTLNSHAIEDKAWNFHLVNKLLTRLHAACSIR